MPLCPNATFNLTCLGLGWPWVGEFVGFVIMFRGFPTQQHLVYRKHPVAVERLTFTNTPQVVIVAVKLYLLVVDFVPVADFMLLQ